MMDSATLKKELMDKCSKLVSDRRERILKAIADIESSLKEESKSTSGDKHHTGRAMLQIERENAGRQLYEIDKVQLQLDKVDIHSASEIASLGNLIHTNHGIFFLSISVGSIKIEDTIYLGVAPNSPIGILLLGKRAGDHFIFNQKEFFLLDIE